MLRNGLFGEGLFDDWMRFPTFHDFDDVEKKLYLFFSTLVQKSAEKSRRFASFGRSSCLI